MQQFLILGINDFGKEVIRQVRTFPIEQNVIYHHLECGPKSRVSDNYLAFRQRLLDVLNREVYNFANSNLTIYLIGFLVEEDMADNLLHLGYLFRTFFRENIILSPRLKLLSAFPTIIPENAYAWLPRTQKTLEQIDSYAALEHPFQPAYPDVHRHLPSISGPPFDDVIFSYSESMDAEDIALSVQAAATKIYFDLEILPKRAAADPNLSQFFRSFPSGQKFAPVCGCAVSFLPSLVKLIRDEMEYLLMVHLCDRFFSADSTQQDSIEPHVENALRASGFIRLEDLIDSIVKQVLEKEKWLDFSEIDILPKYDIQNSSSPDSYLNRLVGSLEEEGKRVSRRVRDLAVAMALPIQEKIVERVKEDLPPLGLTEMDAVCTGAYLRTLKHLETARAIARQYQTQWQESRSELDQKIRRLKEIAGAKDARMKPGSHTEEAIKEVFDTVQVKTLLRQILSVTVCDALAQEEGLPARWRESYDKTRSLFAIFLGKRDGVMGHFYNRRDSYLKNRNLYLYVFNQVFRQRVLDDEIRKKLDEVQQGVPEESLARIFPQFFFKKWSLFPDLALTDVEKEIMEAIQVQARKKIEAVAAEIKVDYGQVAQILYEIADSQVNSIFDMKYKEHPLALYKQAMFLFYKEEAIPEGFSGTRVEGMDLCDIGYIPQLPFQLLQLMEIHNLPFQALRQYGSLNREKN